MLSILIPTYNYNITSLVESLSKQLENVDFSYEILVIDDCSSNAEIVESNKSIENFPNCTFIQNSSNKGRTATRQALAEAATYNWLLFMDADVLPKNEDFIKKFDIENQTAEVVFGGIAYETKKPDKEKVLRWKYGKAREAKPVQKREKMPYLSIISQCFLIKKDVFFKANDFHAHVYGVDVYFTQNLLKKQATVQHIDNPIVHFGLESNSSFIEKTKKGLETLCYFEKEGNIPANFRPIQSAFLNLKEKHLLGLFKLIYKTFESLILKNLMSSKPSLFLFDLYRLNYFCKLKK